MEGDVKWNLCCICQEDLLDHELRSTPTGRESLAKNLIKFRENGAILPSTFNTFIDENSLVSYLETNSASYHKNCFNTYNKNHLDRLKKANAKQKKGNSDQGCSSRRRSLDRHLGENRCCICSEIDLPDNLHRAAEINIKRSHDFDLKKYIQQKTDEWKELATTPGYENLHSQLCLGDLRTNEMFYHNKCWVKLKRDAEAHIKESFRDSFDENVTRFLKVYCMRKTKQYVYDLLYENPSICLEVRHIFEKYKGICEKFRVDYDPNITRFTSNLENNLSDDLEIIKSSRILYIGWAKKIKEAAISAMNATKVPEKISEVAHILRDDIRNFDKKSEISFKFEKDCEVNAIPKRLLSFMAVLLEGDKNKITRGVLTSAQITIYNFRSRKDSVSETGAHKHVYNTPLVMYISLLLHNRYRCKELLDDLNALGLCRGYQVMLEFNTTVGNAEISHYLQENLVVPSRLKFGLLTTVNVDNIDESTSSMTATSSLHGTAISITQHTVDSVTGTSQSEIVIDKKSSNTKLHSLPASYTQVPEIVMSDRINISDENMLPDENLEIMRTYSDLQDQVKVENQWLNHVRKIEELNDEARIAEEKKPHWAAYHAVQQGCASTKKVSNAVLPIFYESAATAGMMKHSMDIAISSTKFLNEGQLAIICADQPLFALMKRLQWLYPVDYGLDKIFIVMGGLHIEKQIEQVLGRYFEGSGIVDHLVLSKVMTNSDTAFLSGSFITRTRYQYQVLVSALNSLMIIEYGKCPENNFDVWIENSMKESAQFKYWYMGLELILRFLIFVRSIRTADIDLYMASLCYWCRWFFIFDHPNYARYASVHLVDLFNAKTENGLAYQLLKKGIFTANKTDRRFSNIHLDQNHEQLNDYLKKSGGIVGLTEDPAALKRFLVCAPLVAELCNDFKNSFAGTNEPFSNKHHAESSYMQQRFLKDKKALLETISSQVNPFNLAQKEIMNIYTHEKAPSSSIIYELESKASSLFEEYLQEVFVDSTQAIYVEIKQNKVHIFGAKNVSTKDNNKSKLQSAKTCNKIVTNLFIASQQRDADLDELFCYEISLPPPAFLSASEINISKTKSALVGCLLNESITLPLDVDCTAILLDGSFIAQCNKPKCVNNIGDYVEQTFISLIKKLLSRFQRVDILFDRYFECSIKDVTRVSRGNGGRFHVMSTTPVPRKWKDFMRNSENKAEMFKLIAECVKNVVIPEGKQVICTSEEKAIGYPVTTQVQNISPCSHEEVDTRILLHAKDAVMQGHSRILIKASDTDVVVLCLSLFTEIGAEKLYVEFGTSKNLRYLPIHEMHASLGPQKCKGLPFFHSFTGCDSTVAFAGYGKLSAWNIWNDFTHEFTEIFGKLSCCTSIDDLADEDVLHVEYFVSALYMRLKTFAPLEINDTRKKMFLTKGVSFDKLPPTKDALYHKILRVIYQCMIWSNSLVREPELPPVESWGWKISDRTLSFIWSSLPDVIKGCWDTFVKCKCKISCTKKCSCRKAGEICTSLCGCKCYTD